LDKFANDWLLSIEIIEMIVEHDLDQLASIENKLREHLTRLKEQRPTIKKLVENGLSLIKKRETI
jgi:cell division protein FtsB